jgi:NADP-dependent 3-hydroxy acid dehydrogenase YdfG
MRAKSRVQHFFSKLKEVGAKCEKLGSNTCIVQCDVTNRDQCQKVVDEGIKKFKKLDVLILDAGISGTQLFENMKTLEIAEYLLLSLTLEK